MKLKDFVGNSSPREWLVQGLLPQGHAILTGGLPGVGKSWLVDGLVIHVAGDKPFLGLPVRTGPVILVDEDTPSDELSVRLQRLAKGLNLSLASLPIEVHSMENIDLSDEKTLQKLEREAVETKSALVVLDCLSKVMGGEFNEISAKDANTAGVFWNRLKANGATVLVVHHLNKKEGDLATDFVKLSRGNDALVANSDTAFGVESGGRNPTRFNVYPVERRRKLRIRELFSVELEDDNTETWARLKWVEPTKHVSDLAKDIFEMVFRRVEGQGVTVYDVKKTLAGAASDPDIRGALHELEQRGIIGHSASAHNLYVYRYPP